MTGVGSGGGGGGGSWFWGLFKVFSLLHLKDNDIYDPFIY